MVNGANAAPESICSGAPGLKRSVKLSGETDCATAPLRSAPASPTMRLSTFDSRQYVRFVEQIVCYRGRGRRCKRHPRQVGTRAPGLGSLTARRRLVFFVGEAFGGLLRQLLDDCVAHLACRHNCLLFAADVGGSETGGKDAGDGRVQPVGGGMEAKRKAQR